MACIVGYSLGLSLDKCRQIFNSCWHFVGWAVVRGPDWFSHKEPIDYGISVGVQSEAMIDACW